jgi:hypothetical protein
MKCSRDLFFVSFFAVRRKERKKLAPLRSDEKKEGMNAFCPIPQPLGGNIGGAAKPRLEWRGY